MSKRGRRTLGVPTFPIPISGRFVPAILLICIGLGLLIYKSVTQEVRDMQDLVTKEGTFTNYSFRKTPEGEKDYGIWLREFSERFELTGPQEASFDTVSFKTAVKPGDRLQVEYNTRENVLKNGGVRKLYGLAAPQKNLTFFVGTESVQQENTGGITYLIYAFLAAGILLYVWQLVKLQRERNAYQEVE
jgi:hypothetical protein